MKYGAVPESDLAGDKSDLAGDNQLKNSMSEELTEKELTDDESKITEGKQPTDGGASTAQFFRLTKIQAALMMFSFSYGSAVIILPNTLLRLGPVTWLLLVAIVIIIVGYCTYLNSQSTCYLIGQQMTTDTLRAPYPAIAELASGPIFRKITVISIYVAMVTTSLGYVLLSATMLDNVFPFIWMDHYNSVRAWTTVICVVMSPVMCFGTIGDLSGAAIFAVCASTLSLLVVVINCMILRFHYGVNSSYVWVKPPPDVYIPDLFTTFGLFAFATGGPSLVVPNIAVQVPDSEKLPRTIFSVFGMLFVLYVVAGTIPYVVFGKATRETVTATFKMFDPFKTVVPIFTVICDVSMSMHLLLEAILTMNPVYQHLECVLGIPVELNWKRIGVRICGIFSMFVVCVLFPAFRSVLSIVGGVPVTLVGVVFPVYIHTKIFENSNCTKFVHAFILVFFVGFMVGNFGFSIEELAKFSLTYIKGHT